MPFQDKLMALRKQKGLSQEELGNLIGVSRQTVSKWELGQSYPDFQRLVALSDFFEISLDLLVKDLDLQEFQEKNQADGMLPDLYRDVQSAKKAVNLILNTFALIGGVGMILLLIVILLWG